MVTINCIRVQNEMNAKESDLDETAEQIDGHRGERSVV